MALVSDEATLKNISGNNAATLASLMSIDAKRILPAISLMASTGGGAGVIDQYFKIMANLKDPDQRDLMFAQNPALKRIFDTEEQAALLGTAAYNKVMGLDHNNPEGTPEVPPRLEEAVASMVVRDAKDPEVRKRVLDGFYDRSSSYQTLEAYSQKGVRAKIGPEELQNVKERWGVEFEPLVMRIASAMTSDPDISFAVENGVVRARVDPFTAKSQARAGNFGPITSIPSQLEDDLVRLNIHNKIVQNGYAKDVQQDPNNWLAKQLNRIDTVHADQNQQKTGKALKVEEAIEAFRNNRTRANLEALRLVNPSLAAKIDARNAEAGGSNGE